jgi:predicted Rossmann fold flavoprotein
VNTSSYDIAVIGAGAAGLMAAIQAGRAAPARRIVAVDGAARLGAKILIAGGGRCNVTHHAVDETAFAGSTPKAIRNVLRRFDVPDTVRFFQELGVELKREETGKLFPVTDRAQTVLDALLTAAGAAGVRLLTGWRAAGVRRDGDGFVVEPANAAQTPVRSRRLVLATGGKSVPRTGSDGGGYALARSLGHAITPRVLPALVPLLLPEGHPLTGLRGIAFEAGLTVVSGTGKRGKHMAGSVLCTHFGLSGPAVLDVSRYFVDVRAEDRQSRLVMNAWPHADPKALEDRLRSLGSRTVLGLLRERLPDRLGRVLLGLAGIPEDRTGAALTRDERRELLRTLTAMDLPITGDRGFRYAEVTAGGVPLSELRLATLESRFAPGLHLCGEICDVDGRIGGFNFQWAWASGTAAGRGAAGT